MNYHKLYELQIKSDAIIWRFIIMNYCTEPYNVTYINYNLNELQIIWSVIIWIATIYNVIIWSVVIWTAIYIYET